MTNQIATVPLSGVRSAQSIVITSGQAGIDPATGEIPPTLAGQIEIAMGNLQRALTQVDASLHDVIKTTVFLTRRQDFAEMNSLYATYFSEPYPARSTVICELALPGLLFEIEAFAVPPRGDKSNDA